MHETLLMIRQLTDARLEAIRKNERPQR